MPSFGKFEKLCVHFVVNYCRMTRGKRLNNSLSGQNFGFDYRGQGVVIDNAGHDVDVDYRGYGVVIDYAGHDVGVDV